MRLKFLRNTLFAPTGNDTRLYKMDEIVDVNDPEAARNLTGGSSPLAIEVKVSPPPVEVKDELPKLKTKTVQARDSKGQLVFNKDKTPVMVEVPDDG